MKRAHWCLNGDRMLSPIINFLLFQLGWFCAVIFGGTPHHVIGAVVVAIVILINLRMAEYPSNEFKLMLVALALGLAWESALTQMGLLVYEYGQLASWLAPHWILALWALFATTINASLSWMKKNLFLAAVFGAIGGPISFYAGMKLGSVVIPQLYSAMATLALGWAVLTPLLVLISNKLDVQGSTNRAELSVSKG